MAGDIDAAADIYRRVIAADRRNSAAWYGLGGARLRARAYGEASEALRHAVRMRPDEVGAWGLLAEVLFKQGDNERAIDTSRWYAADPTKRPLASKIYAFTIPTITS